MKKILLIVRREFLTVVSEKAFIVSVILYPLLILMVIGIRLFGSLESRALHGDTIGVIDQAEIIDFGLVELARSSESSSSLRDSKAGSIYNIKPYDGLESGLQDLRSGKLHVLYVVAPTYRESGTVEIYTRARPGSRGNFAEESSIFQNLLRASVLQSRVEAKTINRVLAPMDLVRLAVTDEGTIVGANPRQDRLKAVVPISFAMILCLWILVASRFMLAATQEERANRVMEIMLSSVNSTQLVWGKLIGLSCVALLQMIVFLIISGFVGISIWSITSMSIGTLALIVPFCMAGYLFFAGLMTGAGMVGWGRSAGFLSMIVWAPIILWDVLSSDPNGATARVLSYIPFTATITMVARLSLSHVPIFEVIGSLCALTLSATLSVLGGVRIFRTATLMYGKRVQLPEIVRWLRQT